MVCGPWVWAKPEIKTQSVLEQLAAKLADRHKHEFQMFSNRTEYTFWVDANSSVTLHLSLNMAEPHYIAVRELKGKDQARVTDVLFDGQARRYEEFSVMYRDIFAELRGPKQAIWRSRHRLIVNHTRSLEFGYMSSHPERLAQAMLERALDLDSKQQGYRVPNGAYLTILHTDYEQALALKQWTSQFLFDMIGNLPQPRVLRVATAAEVMTVIRDQFEQYGYKATIMVAGFDDLPGYEQ